MTPTPVDRRSRPMTSLRVSVTDRCNLRCQYCMPEAEYAWLPREDILDFEETERLVRLFVRLGVDTCASDRRRAAARRDLPMLVAELSRIDGIRDLALTTNGVLLAPARPTRLRRRAAAHHREPRHARAANDSRPDARRRTCARAREASRPRHACFRASRSTRSSCAASTRTRSTPSWTRRTRLGAELRFIEYMDVGGATRWTPDQVFARDEIIAGAGATRPRRRGFLPERWAPADRFALADGQVVGIIASTTSRSAATCDRSRLTADGMWYLCLYAQTGHGPACRAARRRLRRRVGGAAPARPGRIATTVARRNDSSRTVSRSSR